MFYEYMWFQSIVYKVSILQHHNDLLAITAFENTTFLFVDVEKLSHTMHYTSGDFWFHCYMHVVFRLNPYGCIATGREEGMIEIVTHSMTISKIQLWYNHGAFDKESLYEWLKFHNPNEERSVLKSTL